MVKAQVGACGAFFRKSTKCRVLTIKRALSLLAEPFRKEKPLPVFSTSGGHQLIQGAVRGGNPSPITPNIGGIAGIASRTPAGGLVDRNRLEPWPAATSGSKQRHAQSFSGSDEVLVEGGERQFPALREFQIGSVVQGEPVAFSEPGGGGPCLSAVSASNVTGRPRRKPARRCRRLGSRRLLRSAIRSPFRASRGHREGAMAPVSATRSRRSIIGWVCSSSKHHASATGFIDNEAQGRPSLTRSLILRLRSMTPLLVSRRPAAARFAFLR